MPIPAYQTLCTKKERLCTNTWEVKLKLPEGQTMQYKAGQFVLFDVPNIEDPKDIQPRAYSIASPPSQDTELTFLIEFKERGRASLWVRDMLKEGDTVRIQGPLGNFTLDTGTEKDYVFVATGAGLAPFLSHIIWVLEEGETRPMHLFFSVRYEENLFAVDTLKALEERHQNFHTHISLTRPHEEWQGVRGRVTETMPTVIQDFSRINAYVCGSPDMVRDVKNWLLGKGVPKKDLHQEGYI